MRLGSILLQLPMFASLLLVTVAACSSDDEPSTPAAKCGNGKIEGTEKCDGTALGTPAATCSTATAGAKPTGTLTCSTSCTFNTTGCTAAGGAGGTSGAGGTTGGTGGVGTGGSATGGTNAAGGIGGESPTGGVAGQAGAP